MYHCVEPQITDYNIVDFFYLYFVMFQLIVSDDTRFVIDAVVNSETCLDVC